MLDIIDISSWQAGMDLERMFRENTVLDGVIVKSTGGSHYVNPYCDAWVQWLREHKKAWGFYHYLTELSIRRTAREEADWWLANAGNYFGEGTAWVDYEDPVAKALGPEFVHEVLDEVYRRTGIKAGVYMSWGLKTWQDFKPTADDGYPFWCARYANEQFTSWQTNPWQDFSPAPWDRMTMLQYTSKGRVPGWSDRPDQRLDLNLFYGSVDDWNALAKGEAAPEPLKGADPVVIAAVLLNEYGIEPERSERLRAAGYDPHAVQKKINELYAVADKVRPMVSGEMEYLNSIMKILRQ